METTQSNPMILSQIPLAELEDRIDSRIRESLKTFFATKVPDQKNQEDILTFKEGCKFLSIAEATGYSKVSKREIPFIKKGKFIYFSKKQLTEWLHSGTRKTVIELEQDARKITSRKN